MSVFFFISHLSCTCRNLLCLCHSHSQIHGEGVSKLPLDYTSFCQIGLHPSISNSLLAAEAGHLVFLFSGSILPVQYCQQCNTRSPSVHQQLCYENNTGSQDLHVCVYGTNFNSSTIAVQYTWNIIGVCTEDHVLKSRYPSSSSYLFEIDFTCVFISCLWPRFHFTITLSSCQLSYYGACRAEFGGGNVEGNCRISGWKGDKSIV